MDRFGKLLRCTWTGHVDVTIKSSGPGLTRYRIHHHHIAFPLHLPFVQNKVVIIRTKLIIDLMLTQLKDDFDRED